MKRQFLVIIAVAFAFFLSACGSPVPETETVVPTELIAQIPTETIIETSPVEAVIELVPAEIVEETSSVPEHSSLYIPGISADEVIQYFSEVCLDAEFINSGDPSFLQKWVVPIQYGIYGSYTQEDIAVLTDFVQWLNMLEGFPGIREAGDGEIENLRIYFCDQQEMLSRMGESFYGLDGAVTFWYDFNEIYDATICYRMDIGQYTRNSVLLEELYNGLGPIQDTDLRPDSIVYSGFSEPQELTQMDELILKLLYHPSLQCGMDAEECAEAIRQIYY